MSSSGRSQRTQTNTHTSPFAPATQTLRYSLPSPTIHIVNLGDSFGAGQGAPDRAQRRYSDEQCERSNNAAMTKAVDNLISSGQNAYSFEYENFACTGATINVGILGPYAGPGRVLKIAHDSGFRNETALREVGSTPNRSLPSQIDQMQAYVEDNNLPGVDVVSITIGGNDSGCLLYTSPSPRD